MTRILVIGDVHLSDQPPSNRRESYQAEILDKLSFAVEIASHRDCDAIVQAGDLFHVKAPARTSHKLVQITHELLTRHHIPVLVVPGNHDLQHDRLESLSKQPLGTLCRMPGIELLMGPHPTLPLFGIPYLQNYPAMLGRWMKQYVGWADEQKMGHTARLVSWEFAPLLVTHAPIFPPMQEPPYDFISSDDWAELMEKGDCYYGHIHDAHGIYKAVNNPAVWLCNNGALSRGSLHEATLKRKPAVTIWDSEKPHPDRFERVEVPHLPAEEVFRLEEHREEVGRQERVAEFLEDVGTTVLETLTVEEVVKHAEAMELKPGTLDQIRECIEEALSK